MIDFDLSLYLVTDRTLSMGRSLSYIVEEAVLGGVTIVQLREKDCSSREFYELAVQLKKLLKQYHIPLIINDRLDIALASDADGLHIGQGDLPWDIARKMLGREKIIGLSVENLQQAYDANNMDIDYIALSPVYFTATKTDTNQPLGLDGVKEISLVTRHPAVAIGGLNRGNAAEVLKSGASGIAVVSAIVSSPNPRQAAKELKTLFPNSKKSFS